MNINLEQDWLRFDNITSNTASYYGYNTNPAAGDSSNTWAIREIVGSGSLNVYWNNNIPLAYEVSWTNRSYYFATPSNITVTATANSYGGNTYNVTFNWTTSTGSSRYYATFQRDSAAIMNLNDAGSTNQYNPYQNTFVKTYINQNSATLLNCTPGHSYSVSVYASNGFGVSSTATANIAL